MTFALLAAAIGCGWGGRLHLRRAAEKAASCGIQIGADAQCNAPVDDTTQLLQGTCEALRQADQLGTHKADEIDVAVGLCPGSSVPCNIRLGGLLWSCCQPIRA